MDYTIYSYIAWSWTVIGILTFLYLLRQTAPYGRHTTTGWGPVIDNRLGWFIMEFPVLIFLFIFLYKDGKVYNATEKIILALFILHYVHRSLIFPWRLRTTGKKMPLLIAVLALGFNFMNGFLLGYYFNKFSTYPPNGWYSVSFLVGLVVFFVGVYINFTSDNYLISLRKEGEVGYKIPQRGWFRYISCPNLLGEIIEWVGYAILSWNLPALSFAIWTIANLLPRALDHHRWYLRNFPDYPSERKVIFPYIL